ncbi:MAG TPA: FGGY-family carbohydrate kinase [Thermomicrobiales bacterium]
MILGVDAGTSVVKTVAFSKTGEALAVASQPMRTVSPRPGWQEQDVSQVIAGVASTIREVTKQVPEPVEMVGITGQGDGVWLVDEEGQPVRPAILWSDARASDILEGWLADGTGEAVFRQTGNALFPGAAAPVLRALLRDEPDLLAKARTAAYCKDVILQQLTGVRATDLSDASLPFLDVHRRVYDDSLLARFGLSEVAHLLAPIEPSDRLWPLSARGAELTGLPEGTPIHAGPFDLVATMIGAGASQLGDSLIVLGTTLGCSVVTDRVETSGDISGMTLCLDEPNRWLRVMPAMVGTPVIDWVVNLIGVTHAELDGLLMESAPGARGVLVVPLLALSGERAPFVEPNARGWVRGLSLDASRADVVRAFCEGIAYAARHCLEAAGSPSDRPVHVCGGGMRSRQMRQIVANVLGRPLLVARQPEVGARGAAMAALDAAGVPFNRAEWTRPELEVQPESSCRDVYAVGYRAYRDAVAAMREELRRQPNQPHAVA